MKGISIASKKGSFDPVRNETQYASHKEWHKGVAEGDVYQIRYKHLSKDCSLSERDGCALIETMISIPRQNMAPIVGKGRQ
jgi:hypothetical protein